ncbi:rifamycin-inactivating phosphotransferase [Taibaiella chishuiensis]|uniref:Prodigiosin synthesizing transferase PigC n=1 Tax=Taibaiella chishuiensis TaxID=1434707 RepID=A0A2P8D4J9_9BACT|nr:rifamycin-inactivating phosphotransferase [Taibaiella chishuiensis]PSK92099.1 phosphoenolpyruvate synthase [Taibaiella chishuiensis]
MNKDSIYCLPLNQLDQTKIRLAGGKAANLGELMQIEGISVPGGFCITTTAFEKMIGEIPAVGPLLDRLAQLRATDREHITTWSAEIRTMIEAAAIPADITAAIRQSLSAFDEATAWAIRSSATVEDLPEASFAGQQDTYLNVKGHTAVMEHIRRCWASLFTERAVSYRLQQGFGDHKGSLAVVVQQLVEPEAAGILFTADPVSGHRHTVSVDAGFGLGEALVSGLVNADTYKIRAGRIIHKNIPAKEQAIYAVATGGTQTLPIAPEQQREQVLTDIQILELDTLGRRIAAHFGYPQDSEWCLAGGYLYFLQSRPVTTLYPVPEAEDTRFHVYVSVGHQQMMTDAMKPLGLSFWQLVAARPMAAAGGRLFVDITAELRSAAGRDMLINVLGKSDPLIKNALTTLLEAEDTGKHLGITDGDAAAPKAAPPADFKAQIAYDPTLVPRLVRQSEEALETLRQDISRYQGKALFDFIREDAVRRRQSADPQGFAAIMTGMNAAYWLNEHLEKWLGEKNVADILAQSLPDNITSAMGLALLDIADLIRPNPGLVAYLEQMDDDFLKGLAMQTGGPEVKAAIEAFLETYGMRCVGEIDITRPRWQEQPSTLLPLLLSNVRNFEAGASRQKFEQGLQQALAKEKQLLQDLEKLPGGQQKVTDTRQMIGLLRGYSGYREYPKYHIVSRNAVYKQALMAEVDKLVQAGVLATQADSYYLTFDEICEAVSSLKADPALIAERKEAHRRFEKLRPPRVLTSEGEMLNGSYTQDHLPDGAIPGLAVSSGTVEGRARVIADIQQADLEPGDILVTAFTDPSWTPLFVSIKGLVTEVGGLMTHGAVIAREYGLPAVVGVDGATRLIRDGQRIRVNGTDGYITLL